MTEVPMLGSCPGSRHPSSGWAWRERPRLCWPPTSGHLSAQEYAEWRTSDPVFLQWHRGANCGTVGKKLDMGKACIRFRAADDLALDAIAEVVASTPVDCFIAIAEKARRR